MLASTLAFASLADAATVKGKTANVAKLLNAAWNEAAAPGAHRYSFREKSPTVRPDVWNLTAFLPKELAIVVLGDKGTPDKAEKKIGVSGGRTSPVTIVVPPGQALTFENHDPFPHELFEVGAAKGGLGDSKLLATGVQKWTPSIPGKFEIRDKAAPGLRSWVVVEPRAVKVVYPDRKGEFSVDLDPGDYKLRAYFNGEPVGTEMPITVKPAPDKQELKDALKVAD